MAGVTALLSMPVMRRPVVVASVLAPYALMAGPCLAQETIDAEVFTGHQPFAGAVSTEALNHSVTASKAVVADDWLERIPQARW